MHGFLWPLRFFLWLWLLDLLRGGLWGSVLVQAPLRAPAMALFLGLALGALLGLLLAGLLALDRSNPLQDPASGPWQRLQLRHFGPASTAQQAQVGALLGALMVLALLAYPAFALTRSLVISFAQPHFAALAVLASVMGLGLLGLALMAPATALGVRLGRALGRVPLLGRCFRRSGETLLLLLGAGLLLAAGVVAAYWKPFSFLPWESIALVAAALLLSVLWPLLSRRLPRPARRAQLVLLALLAVASAVITLSMGPEARRTRTLVNGFSHGGRWGQAVARLALDFDGDGHIHVLGGGDCAPFNPSRYPGAVDRPDNGVDEDCDGVDLNLAQLDRDVKRDWPVPKSVPRKPAVVLVTVDAFAAQRMAAMGETRGITPNLDRFAKGAALFRSCFAQGPSTRLSFPSIFTSRYDSQIRRKLRGKHPYPIETREVLLAEAMKRHGYRTAAVLPNEYFGRGRWPSITSGFSTVVEEPYRPAKKTPLKPGGTPAKKASGTPAKKASGTPAKKASGTLAAKPSGTPAKKVAAKHNSARVTDAALAQLDNPSKKPLFMWVHYYDAHSPHSQPEGIAARGGHKSDIYEAELQLVDREVGRLLDGLREQLGERALIVVSADHGIAFDQPRHKKLNYGYDLHSITLHVPLMFSAGYIEPRVLDGVVSTMDIAPTIANLTRLRGRTPFVGASLVPELLEGKATRPPRLIHQFYITERRWEREDPLEVMALRDDRFSLIQDRRDGTYQLYDWRADYLEVSDLSYAVQHQRTLQRMKQQLALYTFKLHDGGRPAAPGR